MNWRTSGSARPGAWQASGRARRWVTRPHGGGVVTSIMRGESVALNASSRPVEAFERDDDGQLWLEQRGLDPTIHLLRSPRGWATDVQHLEELRARNDAGVRIHDTLGHRWTASVASFDRHSIPINRGYEEQVVLPERFWYLENASVRLLDLFALLNRPAPMGEVTR